MCTLQLGGRGGGGGAHYKRIILLKARSMASEKSEANTAVPLVHAVKFKEMELGLIMYPTPKPSDTTGPNVNSCRGGTGHGATRARPINRCRHRQPHRYTLPTAIHTPCPTRTPSPANQHNRRSETTSHFCKLTDTQSAPKCDVDNRQVRDWQKMGSANNGCVKPLSAASKRMPKKGRSTPQPFCNVCRGGAPTQNGSQQLHPNECGDMSNRLNASARVPLRYRVTPQHTLDTVM